MVEGGGPRGVRAFSGLDSANKGEEKKNSGVAEEDKTGKMKHGGPASGFVYALVAITAVFLSLS